jgi:hypothetical protein
MARDSHDATERTHLLRFRRIDGDELVVDYEHIVENVSMTKGRHVSARLPLRCLGLFGDNDTVAVADLPAGARAWLRSEDPRIDFEGVEGVTPEVAG